MQTSQKLLFCDNLIETESVKEARCQYPDAKIFNRYIKDRIYFDSACYGRSKLGNCFALFTQKGQRVFGQVQYFVSFDESSFGNGILANIRIYTVLEDIGLKKGIVFRVCRTTKEDMIPVEQLEKVFCYSEVAHKKLGTGDVCYMITICSGFEHS